MRDLWPPGLEAGWARLAGARERLLGIAERVPRVTSHLDVWPVNALRRPSGEVVLVDWAFCGDGAVGEDVGNLIPDSVFDLFWPAERLDELAETCITEYVAGLREAGWAGDEQLVRLGVMATAVKYTWLLPATVAQARDATHSAYFRHVDARALYTARGAAFAPRRLGRRSPPHRRSPGLVRCLHRLRSKIARTVSMVSASAAALSGR